MYGISLSSPNFSLGRGVSSLSVVVRVASARACVGWMRPPWVAGMAAGEYIRELSGVRERMMWRLAGSVTGFLRDGVIYFKDIGRPTMSPLPRYHRPPGRRSHPQYVLSK